MDIVSLVLTALALAADAMSVSITNGIAVKKLQLPKVLLMALLFGGFQALMPTLGWLLGTSVSKYISAFDHWIAFLLLAFIGFKMIVESFKNDEETVKKDPFSITNLLIMAVATSIDALAVGISFASLGIPGSELWLGIALIGVITFTLSCLGAFLGKFLGNMFKKRAGLIAGIILCLIGLKILLEHLGVLTF